MGASIKDVAKLAGVSHTTVSRVINNSNTVKPETRDRVLEVIRQTNFIPHPFARTMTSGRTYAVGLLVLYDMSKFPIEFLSTVLEGITSEITQHGYSLNISFGGGRSAANGVSDQILNENRIDGLFILGMDRRVLLPDALCGGSLPIIALNQRSFGPPVHTVAADDEEGAYQAVAHLYARGRRRIGYINGTPSFGTSESRLRGYRRALAHYGIPADPALETVGFFDNRRAFDAMQAMLELRPDAVFAANDLMALGAMKAVKARGLRIPDDVAVVGFDNQVFAECVDPPLSTVDKPRRAIGVEAARLMMEMISHPQRRAARNVVLPTQLIVREST